MMRTSSTVRAIGWLTTGVVRTSSVWERVTTSGMVMMGAFFLQGDGLVGLLGPHWKLGDAPRGLAGVRVPAFQRSNLSLLLFEPPSHLDVPGVHHGLVPGRFLLHLRFLSSHLMESYC